MMMTRRIGGWAIAALLASSAAASAQSVVTGPEGSPRSLSAGTAGSTRGSSNTAIALLRRPVESVNWDETPFEDVLGWLNDMAEGRVNIVTRWSQLANESVDRDSPVTLRLANTTVAEVLNEALDQLSGEIRYHGIDNQLQISTRADFDRKMYRRVYDVTDIMFRVPNLGRSAPIIDLQQTTGGGSGGGGGGGQSIFSGGGGGGGSEQEEAGQQAEQNLRERLTDLRQLIEQTIAPETWVTEQQGTAAAAAAGAGRGRIRIFNQSLVVYNTIEVHEMIAGWFDLGG